MYRIDTSTASSTKPTIPSAGTEQYFQDTSSGGGTIVPAWFLTMLQEELRNAVVGAGLTPDKTDESQLYTAIAALAAIGAPFAHFQYTEESGTSGSAIVSSTWTTVPVNASAVENSITGASATAGVITLPAGSYRVQFFASISATDVGTSHAFVRSRVRDTTGVSTLAIGSSAKIADVGVVASQISESAGAGAFTLSTASAVELQAWGSSAGKIGLATSSGENELYGNILIWQLSA